MKLYALLIGINTYSENSLQRINSLSACVNDTNNMRQFLLKNYGDIVNENQIQLLTNEAATRTNVIKGFREHLTQAQAEDVVLVYYSGHGSTGITATEFQKFTTDNEEQTWVLHDSRTAAGNDLADKEIALLLEEIGIKKPQIIVIADSCHSGSVTREVEEFQSMTARFTLGDNRPRSLESYLEGAYLQRSKNTIPETPHLLLAACDRTERAWEVSGSGVFTKSVLEILEKNGGQIRYTDLFVQTRARVQSKLTNQSPQLEAHDGFNAQAGFLGRIITSGKLNRYAVQFKDNFWKISLGAANGIELSFDTPIPVKIFQNVTSGSTLADAVLGSVNVSESQLIVTDKSVLDKQEIYWGEPIALPLTPFYIYDRAGVLKSIFEEVTESGIFISDDRKACLFEVKIENENIFIYETATGVLVQGVEGIDEKSASIALEILQKLAKWERLLVLQNKKTKLNTDKAIFALNISEDADKKTLLDEHVTLEINEDEIPFELTFTNNTGRDLYATLLHQGSDYGIKIFSENSQPIAKNNKVTLYEEFFCLDRDKLTDTDTLKLLLSTIPMESWDLSQDGFEIGQFYRKSKDIGNSRGIGKHPPDWFTKNITVRLVRPGKMEIGNQPVEVAKGISIQSHPDFKTNLNWSPLISQTRSINTLAINNTFFKDNPQFQIINVNGSNGSTRGVEDASILEWSNIENNSVLKNNPLKIVIDPNKTQALNPTHVDEIIMPLFYDGEDFLPCGKLEINEQGQYVYEINAIPDETGVIKTRTLGGAIKMVFMKFVNNIVPIGETHKLRWVNYETDAERISEGVAEKIKPANTILLLIHGIIGDTGVMIKTFQPAITDKKVDLVLTFDYENLNTTIEKSAAILKQKLNDLGITEQDNKKLIIVAHSMGGLVARYMIEHLNGSPLVDSLVMAGTPNGGSKFGDIPSMIHKLSWFCTIGLKFFPTVIPAIVVTMIKLTEKTIFVTLDQMSPESDFIKNLFIGQSATSPIPYKVLAGNLDQFIAQEGIGSFSDKLTFQIGDWINEKEPNDIAVMIDNIFKVNAETKQIVFCNHLNYFEVKESVDALFSFISD